MKAGLKQSLVYFPSLPPTSQFFFLLFFELILCPQNVVILRSPALCYDALLRRAVLKAYKSEMCFAL